MGEMALVLFTVLSQTAAGAFITMVLLAALTGNHNENAAKFATGGILVMLIASMLASLGHLGHPLEAYRALSHLETSWLSREILLAGSFLALAFLHFYQLSKGGSTRFSGIAGVIAAILMVGASGMIYVLPAVPAWNNAAPLLFFFLTAATAGPLYFAVLAAARQYAVPGAVYRIIGAALLTGLISLLLYLSMLAGSGDVAAVSGTAILSGGAFWVRLLVGWILPLGFLLNCSRQDGGKPAAGGYLTALFFLVIIGELLGREMFYSSAVALTMFGL